MGSQKGMPAFVTGSPYFGISTFKEEISGSFAAAVIFSFSLMFTRHLLFKIANIAMSIFGVLAIIYILITMGIEVSDY